VVQLVHQFPNLIGHVGGRFVRAADDRAEHPVGDLVGRRRQRFLHQIRVGLVPVGIIRADIGRPQPEMELPYEEIEYRMAQRGVPERAPDGHKGTFGHVTLAAGSVRYPGAAVLAAEAAARSGAGTSRPR